MHQTFYIDVDEEITSVIERLRKAKAHEIIMVVPKRALLIQSIVNLRLLKKEAENIGLQLMIVTQDKLGKLLVEKAGILVQQKLDDNLEGEVVVAPDSFMGANTLENAVEPAASDIGKKRIDQLGSESYFDDMQSREEIIAPKIKRDESGAPGESIVNKELVTGIAGDIRKKAKAYGREIPPNPIILFQQDTKKGDAPKLSRNIAPVQAPRSATVPSDPKAQDKIEHFFYNNHYVNNAGGDSSMEDDVSRGGLSISFWDKIKSATFFALIVAAVISFMYGAYVLVPKATITLSIKEKNKAQDFEIMGDVAATSISADNATIPAKLITVTNEISQKVDTTGGKSISNQKARGEITIYNEFSPGPQPLVATTRFVDESGKLFRLANSVTVPGTSVENGSIKPGEIKSTVVADQAGEEFNVGPSKFSIPGFKDSGGDKYKKIYAVSIKSMAGGGKDNDLVKTISDTDITNAKNKINSEIESSMSQKIKDQAGSGVIVLEEAISPEEVSYKSSGSVGDVADSFQMTASKKATALVFREDDIKNAVSKMMVKSGGSKIKIDKSSITIEYAKANADFKTNTIEIKGHALSRLDPDINIDDFKKGILGKTNDEFESTLGEYHDIEKAEINYWPPFISWKIPTFDKRVDVVINEIKSR